MSFAQQLGKERRDWEVMTPPLDWFVDQYGGEDASDRLDETKDVEAQLDRIWPGWKKKKPFSELPVAVIERIKQLLLRRLLVIQGKAHWGVRIVYRARKTRDGVVRWPMATPVRPAHPIVADDPEVTRHFGPHFSLPHLAASCKLPLEVVEAAMRERPQAVGNARQWCIDWAEKHTVKKKRTKKKRVVTP